MALLLPPAAQPGEGLVLRALEFGEAQLIEDLIDTSLRRHLERTEQMGLHPRGGRVSFGSPAPFMPSFPLCAPEHTVESGAQGCLLPAQHSGWDPSELHKVWV